MRTKSSSRTSEPYVAAGEQSSVRPKEPRYAAPIRLAVEAETILGGGRETVAVRRTEHSYCSLEAARSGQSRSHHHVLVVSSFESLPLAMIWTIRAT
eukprot:COSAG06_NODE_2623_length_6562_cov_9.546031_5_plen_97_part_00